MAGDLILGYGVLATLAFTFLVGGVVGYWIRRGEDHLRRTPTPEARRGRHARGGDDV